MVPNFNFLFARLASSSSSSFTYCKSAQIQSGSLFQHNAFLFCFNSFTSSTSSNSESNENHKKGDTFTMSYLINSCGLSPQLAKELSKGVNLKNPNGPNAVLELLENYGFSKTQVAKLVEKHPMLLFANAKNTLLPKLKFLSSIGVSPIDMPKILIGNHLILLRSLDKCIIPRYEILKGLVGKNEVVRTLRNAPRSFTYCDMMKNLVPNIDVLRQCGVPQSSISLLLAHFPFAAYMKHSQFVKAVKKVEEIGINPLRTTFVMAVQVILTMSKASWESRFEVYEKWGWNREMVLRAFSKFPNFMKLSEETATKKMSFLVNDMGWPSEDIAEFPSTLGFNLEKRIIPRVSVIKILKSEGLLKNNLHLGSFMCIVEEKFLNKFVIKFQKDVPSLPGVYKGLIDHQNVS